MSSEKETIYYMELRAGDAVQDGDQFRDVDGQWKPYTFLADMGGKVGLTVTARRPIGQVTYEEVPGSRTTQEAVEQPQRERWAYEELRPGDVIQQGDEWQNPDGRWHPLVLTPGASMEVRDVLRARRPHNITMMLAAFASSAEVLADAQQAATQLQKERDEARAALKSAQRARDELQLQVDELRTDRRDETTARQVQQVLHRWATELEWSADCFGTGAREQIHGVQNTLIAVMQRIESMIDAEDSRANA